MITVADVMRPAGRLVLNESDSIEDALDRMRQFSVTSLPVVVADRQWKGLVLWTDLDAARTKGPSRVQAVGALARPDLALSPTDPVETALRRMKDHRVGRLPVVDGERLVGSLTQASARSSVETATGPGRIARWQPPTFTARLRDEHNPLPPLHRWETVLRAERSLGYQLASAAARRPFLRRLMGIPGTRGEAGGSLEEREERVQALRESRLGRLIPDPSSEPSAQAGWSPGRRPPIGPLLDQEVWAGLGLLATLPFEELQDRGWHVQPNHFYWPLNEVRFLRENPQLWSGRRRPLDIDWDLEGQVQLAAQLAVHADELSDVREGPPLQGSEFVWDNKSFPRADAYAYYCLVRRLRPARVIEVGAGASSLLLARAVRANECDCEVTLVEPMPNTWQLGGLPDEWRMVQALVQHVDLELFETLAAGDVLFYDGSHSVRTASDVNWMFFEVLPRLAPGVWIHIHDIHWPADYPLKWLLDEGLSWNEQYLLQAFMMHNDAYRVRLAVSMLLIERADEMERLWPGALSGASVWLEKTG